MIPHIIHYCWFGRQLKPKVINNYIEEWKKLLPDYQFMEWNEDNFPIDFCKYTQEAYDLRKYAFVSDVARLYALSCYGGVYLDTDVELIKRFDEYLDKAKVIFSMESKTLLMTGFMAGEKESSVFKILLSEYKQRNFVNADGSLNCVANTVYLTNLMKKYGLNCEKNEQIICENIHIYGHETFGAFNVDTSTYDVTDKTVLIHHCYASWKSKRSRLGHSLRIWLAKNTGGLYEKIRQFKNSRR